MAALEVQPFALQDNILRTMKTTLRLLLIAALLALAACGTKGALVLPDKPSPSA
jgi:hypothetical protein